MRTTHLAVAVLALLAPLAACSTSSGGATDSAVFQTALASKPGTVDAGEAARLISEYRASKGLPPVTVDPTLMQIARVHSDRMAAADTMSHVLPGEGTFHDRLVAGNYDAGMAAENVAAGQRSLAEVLAAWKASPSHDANMLEPHVIEIGIALSVAEGGRYKYFWTLVLGQRKPAGAAAGPSARPDGTVVTIGGAVMSQ